VRTLDRIVASLVAWIALAACGARGGPATPAAVAFPPPTPRLASHVAAVQERFDPARALATAAFADRFFRTRGNAGYQQTLARVREDLAARGIDAVRTLELGPVQPTWTPRSARLALLGQGDAETVLISFDEESDRDRAALLVHSDGAAPWVAEVIRVEHVRGGQSAEGRLVLAEGEPRALFRELVETRGAAGILVRNLEPYHRASEHPDAAQFGYLPPRNLDQRDAERERRAAIGFSLSQRAWEALRAATERGVARARVQADVVLGSSAATAVEARIAGTSPDAGAIVLVAHVDEPGANDNASGVGALVELAGALRQAIEDGAVPPLERTLVFLWGQELEVSTEWLEHAPMPIAAGLVIDMVGQDPAIVGAPFRIERMPDPGALWLRAPDAHSEWGAHEVDPAMVRGHFLNDWMRAATARVDARDPIEWQTVAHPFEGGSDHVSFLRRGLPAVLAWHFTDSAYHTTLDRMDRVSGEEMRRVAAVVGGAAIGIATDTRADREEMLETVRVAALERMRWVEASGVAQLREGGDPALEQQIAHAWTRWYDEALLSVGAWRAADELGERDLSAARTELASAAREVATALTH
jgi:aminopeptidase YwaD